MEKQASNLSPAIQTSDYASFGYRFGALFIDTVLIGILNSALSVFNVSTMSNSGFMTPFSGGFMGVVLGYVYFVVMTTTTGATLGKRIFNLRVQNETTGENLDYMSAILREVVGRFMSGAVLGIGYLWMLWDPKKQTWHDKLAKSVVVRVL